MPRRATRDAFALDRETVDAPRTDVPPADQPESETPLTNVLPKVGDNLPPVPEATTTQTRETPVTNPAGEERPAGAGQQPQQTSAGKPRGRGGRPSRREPEPGITKIPARVPEDIYTAALPLVKGVGCPSWGQLVAWTCTDHPDAVAAAAAELAVPHTASSRRPRGQNREGTAALQVTARLNHDEFTTLEETVAAATNHADTTVTRTQVVIAALREASKHGLSHEK